MRDIKSLKENEAIHISTKKEAKGIAKLFNRENAETVILAFEKYGDKTCIEFHRSKNFVSYASTDFEWFKNTVPASDFLPKKKKKATREWVERYVAKALYAKQTQEAVERALQPSKEQISDLVTTDPAILDVKGAEVVSGLEEGKWFKLPTTSLLIRIIKNLGKGNVLAYGFTCSGKWLNETDFGTSGLIPSTKEEVEKALINEAKNRGFKAGVKYKCIVDGPTRSVERDFYYLNDIDMLTAGCGGAVYCKGKWATIIESEKEIDWSKAGQLVCSDLGIIWQTSGEHTELYFKGTVQYSPKENNIKGVIKDEIIKQGLKLYTGEPITLSNEN